MGVPSHLGDLRIQARDQFIFVGDQDAQIPDSVAAAGDDVSLGDCAGFGGGKEGLVVGDLVGLVGDGVGEIVEVVDEGVDFVLAVGDDAVLGRDDGVLLEAETLEFGEGHGDWKVGRGRGFAVVVFVVVPVGDGWR